MARTHGKASTYRSGCRCLLCTEAQRLKSRRYVGLRAAQGNPIAWNPRSEKVCGHCGANYAGLRGSKYCTVSCGNSARFAATAAQREARARHRQAERDRQARLARAQRKLAAAAKGTAGKATAWVTLRCVVCTTPFTTKWKTAEANEVTCSPPCQALNERERKRVSHDRRRARKKAAYVADVYRKDVYERDGWKCHLCGKAVNRKVEVPHPKAPTIDHVIPLAAGGTHEPLNCRTAHFLCNALKSDRGGGEQLLLIA